MLQVLRENWPIIAFVLTTSAGILTYWSRLWWQIAANVALATKTLADHAELHGEHKTAVEKLRENGHELDTRLRLLEDIRSHADTGKPPVMHVRPHQTEAMQ